MASDVQNLARHLGVKDGPRVLFVGRMIEQKGPGVLLRAFRKVVQRCPNAQLLFVGAPWYSRENSSPYKSFLEDEARDVASNVQFAGYVPHAEMPLYDALADVVCVPSVWDDPSPFVTYEAQACGKPVIASQRGGIPEIVEDRVSGRCIDVFNTPLFAEILEEWCLDTDMAAEIGRKGRERMERRFGVQEARRRLRETYEGMLNSGT